MNRLILVEPSLKFQFGHEQAHASSLAAECTRRGLGFEVLASRNVHQNIAVTLPVRRAFRIHLFARPRFRNRAAALVAWRSWSRQYRRDFCKALGDLEIGHDDCLLLNTVKIAALEGLKGWLSTQPIDRRPSVAIILRLGTEEGLPEPIFPRASRWLYRRVLNKLHTQLGPRLLLATDTTLIGDDFEFLIKRPVASISLPIDVPEPAALRAEKPVHLVFPSVAVSERGFHLLPDALEVALQRCPLLSATVRVASPRKSYAPLIARLSAMAPRVHLVHGPLDESKFYALLADAHAVLLPYDPFTWAKRSSQILAQSAALGRPVIVMRGSFLDYECQAAGIVGVTAEAFTAEALADAICRFVKDRERLVAEAWAACPEQRRRHSVGAFMDRLVEFAEGCERQNSSALTTGRVVWPA